MQRNVFYPKEFFCTNVFFWKMLLTLWLFFHEEHPKNHDSPRKSADLGGNDLARSAALSPPLGPRFAHFPCFGGIPGIPENWENLGFWKKTGPLQHKLLVEIEFRRPLAQPPLVATRDHGRKPQPKRTRNEVDLAAEATTKTPTNQEKRGKHIKIMNVAAQKFKLFFRNGNSMMPEN